jgi:hypothetical protein
LLGFRVCALKESNTASLPGKISLHLSKLQAGAAATCGTGVVCRAGLQELLCDHAKDKKAGHKLARRRSGESALSLTICVPRKESGYAS